MEARATPGEELAEIGRLTLCYERFGDPADPPLLLIMGLGMQMLGWDEEFCEVLVERGFHVIRFDNRDVGRSSKLSGRVNLAAGMAGFTGSAVYTLAEMAEDTVGLLDHLEIERAHLVGASMGGMIGQTIAIEHPTRIRSLTSIMSTTGAPAVGQPRPDVVPILLGPAPTTREAAVERGALVSAAIGSPGLVDEARARRQAGEAWDRCAYPVGVAHQLLAIVSSPDRTEALRQLSLPTLVVHGDADPLVDPSGGRATAEAIPDAELLVVEGMGHDVPDVFADAIIDAVVAITAKAAPPAA